MHRSFLICRLRAFILRLMQLYFTLILDLISQVFHWIFFAQPSFHLFALIVECYHFLVKLEIIFFIIAF